MITDGTGRPYLLTTSWRFDGGHMRAHFKAESATVGERRELLAARFDCFAAYRDPVLLVGYPSGTAPAGLPRQGFKVAPELVPFPEHPAREGESEAVAA